VLIIHTDEHNFRTLGCYRALLPPEAAFVWGKDAKVETPHIDWLAEHGALCDRFYTVSPVCTPSRASFVSGRYPQNTGAHNNNLYLQKDVVTFAEVLGRNGYTTGYAGKWHIDGPAKPGWAMGPEFGFADNRYMYNRGHWKQLEDTPQGPRVKSISNGEPTYAVEGADEKSFTTDFLADRAIDFIKAHKSQPFCYMVSIPDPHGPNRVRAPYDTMFAGMKIEKPRNAPENGAFEDMPRYFGMVKCIDDNVGKIIAALRSEGLLERTIVIFTADHGDMCGEHGKVNKGVPFEASARIPFIIYAPGMVKAGLVVREVVTTVDFKPTLLGLLGLAADAKDEGRDASALFLRGAPAGWRNVGFSRNAPGAWLMSVSTRYKFVVSLRDDPCLFDLEKDPLEMRNLFGLPSSREVVRQMATDLLDYSRKHKDQYAEQEPIKADLAWCAQGQGPYQPPKRQAEAPAAKRGKKGKAAEEEE
jgi:arylsulfatase A-like enzyme